MNSCFPPETLFSSNDTVFASILSLQHFFERTFLKTCFFSRSLRGLAVLFLVNNETRHQKLIFVLPWQMDLLVSVLRYPGWFETNRILFENYIKFSESTFFPYLQIGISCLLSAKWTIHIFPLWNDGFLFLILFFFLLVLIAKFLLRHSNNICFPVKVFPEMASLEQ